MNLVDVDKLKELIADPDDSARYGYLSMFDLEDAEIIEAEPVKHGKWIGQPPTKHWLCSKCNSITTTAHYCWSCYFEYCPYCGAKMDKEQNKDIEKIG